MSLPAKACGPPGTPGLSARMATWSSQKVTSTIQAKSVGCTTEHYSNKQANYEPDGTIDFGSFLTFRVVVAGRFVSPVAICCAQKPRWVHGVATGKPARKPQRPRN